MLQVLVVEAGSAQRAVIVDALCELPGIEVVAEAPGLEALARILATRRIPVVVAGPTLSRVGTAQLCAIAYAAGAQWVLELAGGDEAGALAELASTLTAITQDRAPAALAPAEPMTSADLHLTGIARGAHLRERRRVAHARKLRGGVRLATRLTTEAQDVVREVRETDLPALLHALVPDLARVLPEGVEVKVLSELDAPRVRCVPTEIERFVLGSVLDASEGMPWGGTIWLIVEREDVGSVRLELLDTGNGVPVASAFKARRKLSIDSARAEIERHGGQLRALRETRGASCLQVVLPAA